MSVQAFTISSGSSASGQQDQAQTDRFEISTFKPLYARAELQRALGLVADLSDEAERFLNPNKWLDITTIDACLRLMTRNNPLVLCFSTWSKHTNTPTEEENELFNAGVHSGELKTIV